jgi:hypothetical protein
MPDNENSEVFNRRTHSRAATEVPGPGTDNHATVDCSNSVWNGITNAPFIKNLSGGQEQHLVFSAGHVVQVRHNHIVKIRQPRSTTARQVITIISAENQLHAKAATQIVLEVGILERRQNCKKVRYVSPV